MVFRWSWSLLRCGNSIRVIWGTAIIGMMDFVVRPYFISLGNSLPLLLVLLGVFGGIIAFGFIGLFIGPTLLAVAYALLTELGKVEKQMIDMPPTTV